MKQVQEWLGHSTFSTTADIYAHLDYISKQGSAGVIANLLGESKLPKQLWIYRSCIKHTVMRQKRSFLLGAKEKAADSFKSATSGGDGGIRTHVPG